METKESGQKNTAVKQRDSSTSRITLGDSFFLSATNPLATVDQRDLEVLALRIMQTPEVQKAREISAARMKMLAGPDVPAEAWSSFEDVMEEWVYHFAMMAANLDPGDPKILGCQFGPPHEWFGMKVPGSRGFGGVNPDNNYVIFPIDSYARFEISGQRFDPSPVDVTFSSNGNTLLSQTLGNLAWKDVQVNPDGSFVITLDPQPANGRHNHVQTGPDARFVFIREVRGLGREVPNAYRIKRLDPPVAPPLTFLQMAQCAARYIIDDTAGIYQYMAMPTTKPANIVEQPFAAGSVGGLVTQMMGMARLKLADDEAFVLTTGGSEYHVIPIFNYWVSSINFWDYTSSMNSRQSQPNADGSTTYVISIQDPGVYNWIDTVGLHEPRLQMRWHNPTLGKGPWIKGELVKLKDLDKRLLAETKWVTPEERKLQLAQRLELFKVRFIDH